MEVVEFASAWGRDDSRLAEVSGLPVERLAVLRRRITDSNGFGS
jgi:hypothetical protein